MCKYVHAIQQNTKKGRGVKTHPSLTPSSPMTPFNNGTKVEKKDLKIGDVVRISTTIDIRDIADPSSKVANR